LIDLDGFTILYQDRKAALHKQGGVEHDQAEAQWHYIVAGTHFEEISNSLLDLPIRTQFNDAVSCFGLAFEG
jgi:hypothetical protein